MGDSARQRTDGLHAAGLLQIRFQPLSVLLEKHSFDGIGDGVERHAQETQLARLGGGFLSHRIETEDPLEAVYAFAPEAQPAT